MKRAILVVVAACLGLGLGLLAGQRAPAAPDSASAPGAAHLDGDLNHEAWVKAISAPPGEERALLEALAAGKGEGIEALWVRAQALRRLGRPAHVELDALEESAPPELRVRARLLRVPLGADRLRYERACRPFLAPVEGAGDWGRLLAALRLAVYGRPGSALVAGEALEHALGEDPAYWAHLSTLRSLKGKGAIATLDRALELDPSDPRLHLAQATRFLLSVKVASASAACERAAALIPDAPQVARMRALIGVEALTTPADQIPDLPRSPQEWERVLAGSSRPPDELIELRERVTEAFPDYAGGWSWLGARKLQAKTRLSAATTCLARGWQRAELPQSKARIAAHLMKLVQDGAPVPALPKDSSLGRLLLFVRLRAEAPWESVWTRWKRALAEHPDELLLACELLKERAWREPLQKVLVAAADFEVRCREAAAVVALARWGARLAELPEKGALEAAEKRIAMAIDLDPQAPEPWLASALLLQSRRQPEVAMQRLSSATLRGRSWEAHLRLSELALGFNKLMCANLGELAVLAAPLDPRGVFTAIVSLENAAHAKWLRRLGGPVARADLNLGLLHVRQGRRRQALEILHRTQGQDLPPEDRLARAQLALGLGQREVARLDLEHLEGRWPRRRAVLALRTVLGE
jgi:Tfp pilus assembly protein PilF